MSIDITQIVIALIGVLTTVLTTVVIPYFKSRTTAEQRDNIYFWAKIAVQAAEKLYKESGQGKIKKEYVKEFLASHGIILDEAQLDVVIESAVLQMQTELAAA